MLTHDVTPRVISTSKLFYGKWYYKVECFVRYSHFLKFHPANFVVSWAEREIKNIENRTPEYFSRYDDKKIGVYEQKSIKNLIQTYEALRDFAKKSEKYLKMNEIKTRNEAAIFSFYLNDKDVFEEMQKDLHPWIQSVTKPSSEKEIEFFNQGNRKKVLVRNYPRDTYGYKVFINRTMESEQRKNFKNWTDKYTGTILISGCTLHWLSGTKFRNNTPFLYVKDEKTLSMVLLFLGKYVKNIEEYVLRSDINS